MVKQNVKLDVATVLSEATMIFSGFYTDIILSTPLNDVVSTSCNRVMSLSAEQIMHLDRVYTMQDGKS